MINPRRTIPILLVFTALATNVDNAAHAATSTTAQTAQPDRVQEMNGITFVSGGIGTDSRASLAAREKSYNFKLILTLEGAGTFVSDALVTLASASGRKLVEHVAEGPLFLAGLPAGAYIVTATFRKVTHTRKFQVRADWLHTEHMRWPIDPALDVTTPWEK
ncbi:MAG TPA: hypothetical protein VK642_16400 [Burkholderiales bacterium]|nr:hypothetical protein [Burkholderiales bacterium]